MKKYFITLILLRFLETSTTTEDCLLEMVFEPWGLQHPRPPARERGSLLRRDVDQVDVLSQGYYMHLPSIFGPHQLLSGVQAQCSSNYTHVE